MANAVDDHVVELNAMRTSEVRLSLRRLLEKLQPRGRRREILVAVADLDFLAFGDDDAVQGCAHGWVLFCTGCGRPSGRRITVRSSHAENLQTSRKHWSIQPVLPPPLFRREIGTTRTWRQRRRWTNRF